jgi:hypothetical protein
MFARWSWHHRTGQGALGASIGERLRRAEGGRRKVRSDDAQAGLPLSCVEGDPPTPICDRIEAILADPAGHVRQDGGEFWVTR